MSSISFSSNSRTCITNSKSYSLLRRIFKNLSSYLHRWYKYWWRNQETKGRCLSCCWYTRKSSWYVKERTFESWSFKIIRTGRSWWNVRKRFQRLNKWYFQVNSRWYLNRLVLSYHANRNSWNDKTIHERTCKNIGQEWRTYTWWY